MPVIQENPYMEKPINVIQENQYGGEPINGVKGYGDLYSPLSESHLRGQEESQRNAG